MARVRRPPSRELGERVRKLRLERGLTQEKLGQRVGLDRTHIGFVEQARRDVRFTTLLLIAKALDVDVGDLVRGIEPA